MARIKEQEFGPRLLALRCFDSKRNDNLPPFPLAEPKHPQLVTKFEPTSLVSASAAKAESGGSPKTGVSDVAVAEHFHRIGQTEKGAEGKSRDSVGFDEVTLFQGDEFESASQFSQSLLARWIQTVSRSVRLHPLLRQSADRPCLA